MPRFPNKQAGFTLIELLIVILVMGVLAGVVISVIDPIEKENIAKDGAIKQNLNEVYIGLESFRTAEGFYPDDGSNDSPLDASAADRDVAIRYIRTWPPFFDYTDSGGNFSIQVPMASSSDFFKYSSVWKEIRECADTTDPSDVSDCD